MSITVLVRLKRRPESTNISRAKDENSTLEREREAPYIFGTFHGLVISILKFNRWLLTSLVSSDARKTNSGVLSRRVNSS